MSHYRIKKMEHVFLKAQNSFALRSPLGIKSHRWYRINWLPLKALRDRQTIVSHVLTVFCPISHGLYRAFNSLINGYCIPAKMFHSVNAERWNCLREITRRWNSNAETWNVISPSPPPPPPFRPISHDIKRTWNYQVFFLNPEKFIKSIFHFH